MRITLASKAAVEARLLNAPEEGRPARVKVSGGRRLTGLVGPADSLNQLPMLLDADCPDGITIHSPLHVTIEEGSDTFSFYTNISEFTDARHLLLRFPISIQIREHRQEPRTSISPSEGIRIELSDGRRYLSFPVLDMSNSGLSFRFMPNSVLLRTGETFTARLQTAKMKPCMANFEVRNVRSTLPTGGFCVAGVKAVSPPPDLMHWLRQARGEFHDAA